MDGFPLIRVIQELWKLKIQLPNSAETIKGMEDETFCMFFHRFFLITCNVM